MRRSGSARAFLFHFRNRARTHRFGSDESLARAEKFPVPSWWQPPRSFGTRFFTLFLVCALLAMLHMGAEEWLSRQVSETDLVTADFRAISWGGGTELRAATNA